MILCALALAGTMISGFTGPGSPPPTLSVLVRLIELPATAEIELQNSSPDPIDSLLTLTLWLHPVGERRDDRCRVLLSTHLDWDSGNSYQLRQPDAATSRLRLPARASRSTTVRLEDLRWGLPSPLDVGSKYELWEVAECAEYDLTVWVLLDGSPVWPVSRRLRLSLDRGPRTPHGTSGRANPDEPGAARFR